MAVLSTIIGRGPIGSRPAAGTEGSLYYATDEGILYRDSGSAWEAYGFTGIVYEFSTTTSDADPGVGHLRFNNATPASVTEIYVDDQSYSSDADLGAMWDAVTGARVLITQADDPAKYLLAEVTADTDGTGYWKLTVTIDDSGTLPDDGALLNVIVLGGGGGGGGSSTPWWLDVSKRQIVQVARFTEGNSVTQAAQSEGFSVPGLHSGTTVDEGDQGSGGFTAEGQVYCNEFYDTSPATGNLRGIDSNVKDVYYGSGHYFRTSIKVNDAGSQDVIVGFRESLLHGASLTPKAVAFLYREGTDTNWMCHSDNGTNSEQTDSGVAFATGTWFNLEVHVYDDGGTMTAKFYINGTLVATNTTYVPAASDFSFSCAVETYFQSGGDTGNDDVSFYCWGWEWYTRNDDVLIDKGWATAE